MIRKIRGTVLILLGLALAFYGAFLFNQYEQQSARADQNAAVLLEALSQTMEKRHLEGVEAEAPEGQMPLIMIEGHALIGRLKAPAVGIDLPVLDNWSYQKLEHGICLYSGSLQEENLILLGHNYKKHLGRLDQLALGDTMEFMDVTGKTHLFEIVKTETLKATQVEELESSQYPLAVFTCTPNGQSRYVVYCTAAGQEKG